MTPAPSRSSGGREAGQAAVETALTLPLGLFLALGILQLFLMQQARLLAEHAAFKAVRAGALSQGSCTRMIHSALVTLLPTFRRVDAANIGTNFADVSANAYEPGRDSNHSGDIVWFIRKSPLRANIPFADDAAFDDPDLPLRRLEVEMVFWYPMRIPFANWVISRMLLAHFGLREYTALNPLMVAQNAEWQLGTATLDQTAYGGLPGTVQNQFLARTNSAQGVYPFPIQVTAAMRMMTPARAAFFTPQHCR